MGCMKLWKRKARREIPETDSIEEARRIVEADLLDPASDARVWRMTFYGPCTNCGEPRDIRQIKLRRGIYYQLYCPSCRKVAV